MKNLTLRLRGNAVYFHHYFMIHKHTKTVAIVASLLLVASLSFQCRTKGDPKNSIKDSTHTLAAEEECAKELAAQRNYLDREVYSSQYTFDKYPSPNEILLTPLKADPNSSVHARLFRTKLNEQLGNTPVNFDGRFSIVAVGMTGWGQNYWIIDRKTGHAYEFPYHAMSLDFKKESNLIIMNSKENIRKLLNENPEAGCYYYNQEKVTDFRPFYFKWESSNLLLLAPTDIKPTVNTFWIDYSSDIPVGTSEPLAYFIREAKKRVIAATHTVPQSEGYTGFELLKAYRSLLPEDFTGVETRYGNYKTINGELYFEGNAPSNAAALDIKGWQQLLRNLSKRLRLQTTTQKDIDTILSFISKSK
jgi:hypothetical protein